MNILYHGLAKGKYVQAVKSFSQGNYKNAIAIWEDLSDQYPNDTLAMKGLACCYFLEDRNREARSLLEDARSIAAIDPEIHNLLALCYLKDNNVQQAIEVILDAQELQKDPLLNKTLTKIKNLNSPEHANIIPLKSLIQLTLPRTNFISPIFLAKLKKISPILTPVVCIIFIILFYPDLRNFVTSLNVRNRFEVTPTSDISIQNIEKIVNSRENYRILLDEKVIIRKFNELKQAISDQHPNRARILVNELLASNAGLAIKERVQILESFIVDSTSDNIDYVPRYAEIAVAPAIYEDIIIRWQGTIANVHHQRRKKTTFDLLVNFVDRGQVEGIALVELPGFQEYNNGDKITVIGKVFGITKDNRIIIEGIQILPH